MYWVYAIWNHTKRQIYIGISNDIDRRWNEHRNGQVTTTSGWFRSGDSVDFKRLPSSNFSNQSSASEYAHMVEREASVKGYRIIETAGI
jgi:predicted GIY-YIG superfamily endonuclease